MWVIGPHGGLEPHQRRVPAPGESIPPPVVAEREEDGNAQGWLESRWGRTSWFFRLRVALWGIVLLGVASWGAHDWSARRARTSWQRPLRVALVLVEREPMPPATLALLTSRIFELEHRLEEEYTRYTGRTGRPIEIVVRGSGTVETPPPTLRGDGPLDLALHSARLWRWTSERDSRAKLEWLGYDSRIYLVLKPTDLVGTAFVEGESEDGGRVGIAQADIGPDSLDFALFVAAHELLHTLGAGDKYGAAGEALFPQGFAEPERAPLFPQPGAEVMARNVPIAAGRERPPESLSELYVGETTAREIGWLGSRQR